MKPNYIIKISTIILLLNIIIFNSYADTSAVKTELYNIQIGSPDNPKNLKLGITLPESYKNTSFTSDNLNVYIYPEALNTLTGKREQYHAKDILFWQYNNHLFLDIRKPPQQRNGGNHNVYIELSKNSNLIFKSELNEKVRYDYDETDVVLIIDSSLSMRKNDPKKNRLEAAKAFVNMARADKQIRNIGIVSFNNNAKTIAKLTPTRNSRRLHKAIEQIGSGGQTDIGNALDKALEILDFAQSKRTAVVLLTDGKNESTPYLNQHENYIKRKIPIYCIGLSDNADTALLKSIADATDAKFFQTSENQDLLGIYQRIASTISRREIILSKTLTHEQNKIAVPVDQSIRNISFILNADNDEAELVLINPDGKVIDSTVKQYDNYKEIRINKPETGLWTAAIKKRLSKRELEINVTGDTALYLDSFPPLITGSKVWLCATLANNGNAISNAEIRVFSPKGQKKLYDDGKHYDNSAHDGIYTCSFPIPDKSDFELLLRGWGTRKQPYLRQVDIGTLNSFGMQASSPQIQYSLTAEIENKFSYSLAGTKALQSINLSYAGTPDEIKATFSDLHNSVYTISSENISINIDTLSAGNNSGDILVNIPSQIPEGIYTGNVNFKTEHAEAELPIKLTIVEPKLILENATIDLGKLNPGESKEGSFALTLHSPIEQSIEIYSVDSAFMIESTKTILNPDSKGTINFKVTAPNNPTETLHCKNIILQSDNTEVRAVIKFEISEQSKKQNTLCFAHEHTLSAPVVKVSTNIFTHEMSFKKPEINPSPTIVEQKTILLVHEIKPDKPVTNLLPVENNINEKSPLVTDRHYTVQSVNMEKSIQIMLVITATLAALAICIVIRKASQHKMVRFALLSLIIHLPITASIASYLIVSKEYSQQNIETTFQFTSVTNDSATHNTVAEVFIAENNHNDLQNIREDNIAITNTESDLTLNTNAAVSFENDSLIIQEEDNLSAKFTDSIDSIDTAIFSNDSPALAVDTITHETEVSDTIELIPSFAANSTNNSPLPALPTITRELIDNNEHSIETASIDSTDSIPSVEENPAELFADIDNLLNDNIDIEIPQDSTSLVPELNGNVDIISNNEIAADTSIQDFSNSEDSLTHNLNSEIETAELLNSLSKNHLQNEEPEQLLTSIAQTAPIEKPVDLPLINSFTEISEQTPDFAEDILSPVDSISDKDILFEIKPITTEAKNVELDPLDNLPAITNDNPFIDSAIDDNHDRTNEIIGAIEDNSFNDIPTITPDIPAEISIDLSENSFATPSAETDINELSLLEQSIEIPVEDTEMEIPFDNNSQPEVIASIDDLDLAITEKLSHLKVAEKPAIEKADAIQYKPASLPLEEVEEYIPSIPKITKIPAPEIAAENTPQIQEISKTEINNFTLETEHTADTESIIPTITKKNNIEDIEKSEVTIVNKPEMLEVQPILPINIKKEKQSEKKDDFIAADSGIDNIIINIGLLTDIEEHLTQIPDYAKIRKEYIDLNTDDISSYQLIIINKEQLSSKELNILNDYIGNGGYLWIQDQGIPVQLSGLGYIEKISTTEPVFNSAYQITSTDLLFAEKLTTINNGLVIATGCRSKQTDTPILINILNTFFGGLNTDKTTETPKNVTHKKINIWQNFSGIAEKMLGWKGPKWGNTVYTGLAPDGQGGEALRINIKPGNENFTSVNYIIPDHEGRRIDLSANKEVILDIYNASRRLVELSVGLTTNTNNEGWNEFETPKVELKSGWNRNVTIPLQNFRSRKDSQNNYTHKLASAENCARVSFYLTNIKNGGTFLIDNIKWTE